ncbi:hypothetical protein [Spirilliplanes yamanashiensis]|uniref:Uncharacterized protein n=1 Tax=Spirilliplanes yamanashiensis TaxID=42233 RepID=A0A8J3YDA8_9ACTN|nr:hypothetical protein [Spirilliplanes yamanashiensis]MDP9816212.1 hypothetical protein [Spirilliplanes yamanashiensis]GIJ05737.1 hypothetical protein Sya03_50890 [Spirilliplanes yamanashiensis]
MTGIEIHGDNTGAVAAGRGARATVHQAAPPPAEQAAALLALAELRRAIDRHTADLPDADLMTRAVARAGDEVRRDRPDPEAARDAIAAVTRRAGAVTAVLTAAAQAQALLTGLWPG